jgi:hypothetical protein
MFGAFFVVLLAIVTPQIKADISPQSNCLFHNDKGLFVLLDLKGKDPYWVTTTAKDDVFFNFCDPFPLPQCNISESYFGYVVMNPSKRCFPLTSMHSGKFETHYGYEESIGQNALDINFEKDLTDKDNYHLNLRIICSEK